MLFDLAAYVRPLPNHVLVFASGTNQETEIVGFGRLGIPLGVSVQRLSRSAREAVIRAGVPVMVDSGAFSEVTFSVQECRTVAPISDAEWRRRLEIYIELAAALGPSAYVIAPDKVGDQQETLLRLSRYRRELAVIASAGATVLLPLAVGARSHEDFLLEAEEASGIALVPAMPMRKAATSTAALLSYVEHNRPRHIHLLGMGIGNRRAQKILDAIRYLSPCTAVSMDSNQLRAVVGRRRPLTRLETELRTAQTECLFGAVDSPVLRINDENLDYTDLIAFPSLWASPEQLDAIAMHAALSLSEAKSVARNSRQLPSVRVAGPRELRLDRASARIPRTGSRLGATCDAADCLWHPQRGDSGSVSRLAHRCADRKSSLILREDRTCNFIMTTAAGR